MERKTKLNKEIKQMIGVKNLRKIAARESAFARMAEDRGDKEMAKECRKVMNWALKTICLRKLEADYERQKKDILKRFN